jgi:dihydroorotate dehydrogenase
MLYRLARPLLFALEAETAHRLSLPSLQLLHRVGLAPLPGAPLVANATRLMGLEFPNPVGLAAGLDKNGEYIDLLAAFGFGFIEVGTVTPRPQPGNPKPRMFRLPQAEAIINRLGFNNEGVDALVANVRRARYRGILGINIGKNFDTPMERAVDDYVACLRKVYAHASYVTVNISSPNTRNLRQLQQADELGRLLAALADERTRLARESGRNVPLAVKVAPDLEQSAIAAIAALLVEHGIDALIATNTTVSRASVAGMPHGAELGGLSGAPLRSLSTSVLRAFGRELRGRIPIIGVGGILSAADAREKIAAGASLVQLYTGLVYRGPRLAREVIAGLGTRS